MKAIIIEDEKLAAHRLCQLVESLDTDIKIEGIFDGVLEAKDYLDTHQQPELIFLDVHLSDGSAFDLLERVEIYSPIIFTTAYDDYVEKAFAEEAFDYLLKPIRRNELSETLQRIKNHKFSNKEKITALHFEKEPSFLIRYGSRYHMVKVKDIAFIYHAENINILVTHSGKSLPINIRLPQIYNQLDQQNYFHVKDKLIVHLDALRGFQETEKENYVHILLHPFPEEKILIRKKEFQQIEKWLKN